MHQGRPIERKSTHGRRRLDFRAIFIVALLSGNAIAMGPNSARACSEPVFLNIPQALEAAEVVVQARVLSQVNWPWESVLELETSETLWGFPSLSHWTVRVPIANAGMINRTGLEYIVFLKGGVDQHGLRYVGIVDQSPLCGADGILPAMPETKYAVAAAIRDRLEETPQGVPHREAMPGTVILQMPL